MASESEEVAEDYRLALEDLSSNMRFEISNLTVIARENTEHALAIAEVLQQHILKVRYQTKPSKKRRLYCVAIFPSFLLCSLCPIMLLTDTRRHLPRSSRLYMFSTRS
jgi:pre-mRNA cleavage complex 2 protein Pcf11